MAQHCRNCGAELFEGQQFCRSCGAPTRPFSNEEAQTLILPGKVHAPDDAGGTTRLPGGRNTDPTFPANYTAYQSPLQAASTQPALHTAPVKRRSRAPLWIAFVVLLVAAVGGGSLFVAQLIRQNTGSTVKRIVVKPPAPPAVAPIPALPGVPGHAGHQAGKEAELSEAGAEVSGSETVITNTYPLTDESVFSIQNINGPVEIEGWDSDEAEVKIIKRGGSESARGNLPIRITQGAHNLAFRTPPESLAGVEEVRYEVRLPHKLREIEIKSVNSNVSISDVSATVSIIVQRGNITLDDVAGTVNTKTTKGNTSVTFEDVSPNAPQVYNGIHGNIEVDFPDEINTEVKAETIDGDIEVDDDLGLKVEKRMVGQQALGRVGKGGHPVVIKVISGNIKIEQ